MISITWIVARVVLPKKGQTWVSFPPDLYRGVHLVRVRFRGVGSFVPRRAVGNEKITRAVPGWSPERIEEKVGIRERRFLWDFDPERGIALPPPPDAELYPANNVEMCEVALKAALIQGEVLPAEVDALFVVTCTPDELNFNHDAMALHQRLGLRTDAFALVIDDGCGGTPYVIDLARKMIEGGQFRTIAIVASAFTSALLNREEYTSRVKGDGGCKELHAFLSMYVFGDGASAVILHGEVGTEDSPGIVASLSGNAHERLVVRRGGGTLRLGYQGRTNPGDNAFVIDGLKVARSYPQYMRTCIDGVLGDDAALRARVRRFYFHQPNQRLMNRFVATLGVDPSRIPSHVSRYGNTSAAGMLTLLAEDLDEGQVAYGEGDLVLIAAVGANVHYGAQLVRL